jgi:hypothetical protein
MIDKIILNARDSLEYQETASLPARQSKLNMEAALEKERADLRLSFLILKNTQEGFYSG